MPLRAIARRNVRARALLRKPFPGAAAEAALEERYARDLVEELPGDREWRGVRACAASALGAPGKCLTAAFAEGK